VGARALGRRPWGRISTLFAVISKRVLSRNLDLSMLKNVYFLKKNCKNLLSVGGSAPEPRLPPAAGGFDPKPPRCYSRLLLQIFPIRFSRMMRFITFKRRKHNYSKCSAFASFTLLAHIFHFKLCRFC